MNSRLQRVVDDPEPELVAPLSGPSYGPFNVARRRWHKPLGAIVADAVANSQALLTRLERGVYCTDLEGKPYYQNCLTEVCKRTRQQLEALEAFSAIEWRE
jgi:hypothetical protein